MSCKVLRHHLPGSVANGKRALRAPDAAKVSIADAECSVDLDAHGPASARGIKRWDYVLFRRNGDGHGVEVHPAATSDVADVIAKKTWARRILSEYGIELRAWHWVASGSVHIRRHERAAKRLDEAGIRFPREHVRIE